MKAIFVFLLIVISLSSCSNERYVLTFESWYHDVNPTTNKLSLKVKDNGDIGVFAKEDIEDIEDTLFSIPLEMMATEYTIKKSPFGSYLENLNELFDYEKIALWYLYKTHSSNEDKINNNDDDQFFNKFEWKKYFRLLKDPEEIHNVFNYNDEELNMLKPSYQYDVALNTIERSNLSFNILKEKLNSSIFNECVQSYDKWKNALSVIFSSRIILHDYEKDEYFSALIPFFDLISQKDDNQVTKWYSSKGVLYVYLDVPVKTGDELFREVGLDCSTELLILKGFINDNLHKPCVSIPERVIDLNRDNNERLFKKRYEFGKQYKLLDEDRYKIFMEGYTQELMASLELMFMNERDFVSADEEEQEEATRRIRKDMYEYLYRELKTRLDRYPTYEPSTLNTKNKQLINDVIEEEKKVIREFLNTLSEMFLDEDFLEEFEEKPKDEL